jgi:hypothetical protein
MFIHHNIIINKHIKKMARKYIKIGIYDDKSKNVKRGIRMRPEVFQYKKRGLSSHGLPKRSPTLVLTMPEAA